MSVYMENKGYRILTLSFTHTPYCRYLTFNHITSHMATIACQETTLAEDKIEAKKVSGIVED